MITIESIDDLLDTGVGLLLEEIPQEQLKFTEDMVVKIRICGQSWDGTIDYRGAQYILELQQAVNRLYVEIYGDLVPSRNLSKLIPVKVRIAKGSTWIEILLDKVCGHMVGNLTGPETLMLAGMGLGAATAIYTAKKIIDSRERIALKAIEKDKDTEIVEKLTSTIDKALEVIAREDMEAPTRKLLSKMDPDDIIELPNEEPVTAATAKKRYPRQPRSKKLYGTFDAGYKITNIDVEKAPPEFTLVHGGLTFKAEPKLSDREIEQLTKDFETSWKAKTEFTLNLHVFIEYTKRGIKEASIVGIGDPREDTEDINKLIQMW